MKGTTMKRFLSKLAKLFRNGPAPRMSRREREYLRSMAVNTNGAPMMGRTDVSGSAYGAGRERGSSWHH